MKNPVATASFRESFDGVKALAKQLRSAKDRVSQLVSHPSLIGWLLAPTILIGDSSLGHVGRTSKIFGVRRSRVAIFYSQHLRPNHLPNVSRPPTVPAKADLRNAGARYDRQHAHGVRYFQARTKGWSLRTMHIVRCMGSARSKQNLERHSMRFCAPVSRAVAVLRIPKITLLLQEAFLPDPGYFINELRDGRVIAISRRPMPDGGSVAIHQDITEQKRAEARSYTSLTTTHSQILATACCFWRRSVRRRCGVRQGVERLLCIYWI